MRKVITVAIVMMLAMVMLLAGCTTGSTPTGINEGEHAPDFQLKSLDGKTVSLSDYRGKTVLLNFWASWCGPCVGEMPYLQEIHQEWSAKGLVLLTVNVGESSYQANGFMQNYGLTLQVLLDTSGSVAEQYSIMGIPTTFFIDKDGIIQKKVVGAFPSKEYIEQYLAEIIP
jgi:peroxiredoxin